MDLGDLNKDSISKGPVKISMQSLGFPQLVSKATHIRGVCLDHIYIMMMMMTMRMMMMNCFCGMVDRRQAFSLISSWDHYKRSSPSRISEHPASRIWTCAEPEFRLSWRKLCSSDNHYTMVPLGVADKHFPKPCFINPFY